MDNFNLMSWNVRGLNKRNKQIAVNDICKINKIGIGALLETKIKGDRVEEFIHCKVLIWATGQSFCFTIVYGLNQLELRKGLWSELASISLPVKPWLVLGAFNSVFDVEDRIGGKVISPKEVEDARNWLDLGNVEEMKLLGSYYTWSNIQDGNNRIFSKLDRVFINKDWIDMFPNVNAIAIWEVFLDHCAIVLKHISVIKNGLRPFQFFNMWTNHPLFKPTVLDSWNKELPSEGYGLQQILRKLHRLQFILKRFNWRVVGDIVKEYEESKHFQSFLDETSATTGLVDTSVALSGPILFIEDQAFLIKPFTFKEVKTAMFNIKTIKSPGPDRFGAGFYKSLWSNIGKEVASAVLEFFDLGHIPKRLNSTILALIPKVTQPSNASEYRPIACCNTLYKCISKMLCNKLIPILPKVVNQNQGAFVKNRSIAHNILILQDLLKGYNRKRVSPRCLMKIDLSKSYDSIDWNFLESLLNAYKFPGRFIKWVMVCLRGSSYSILMNDDLLLMCKAHLSSIQIMQQAFQEFSSASGLSINQAKSSIYFGGITSAEKEKLLCLSKLREGQFPLKYLGVPLRPTKWKAMDCDIIISKIRQRLHGWASRNLSYAGRVRLIQSVLLGIRNFWMSIFLLPQKVIKEIDCLCRGFLWGGNGVCSKFHLASWDHVCRPKSYGGLGFKESVLWNKINLTRYVWMIFSKQDSLWVKWVNFIYLKGVRIWDYDIHQDTSWYWKILVKVSKLLSETELITAVSKGKIRLNSLYLNFISGSPSKVLKFIWCKLSMPKHRFILWQAYHQKLLTRDLLYHCNIPISSQSCPVCDTEMESDAHLFFNCLFSRKVLQAVEKWLGNLIWPWQFQV
ncbi:uncharacterized protein LOC133815539 [Humulus lupulus]|uniref:uncharacterized protein LOC133815539 n=1 Tax=Humulus lupulus TaxID=3486 RepID=UPI002B4020B8|nr:uncharacterized protein LOC133815539 [Humulus lupulus]